MEACDDILRPLTQTEIEDLFQLYKSKYGALHFQYLLIYNQRKWNRQLRALNKDEQLAHNNWISFKRTLYTHRYADFRKYGTYVSLHRDFKQWISFHSWEPELTELWECLSETKLIEWKHGPLLTNVDPHLCEGVKRIATSKGTSVQRARVCVGLVMPREKALHLKTPILPVGYFMNKLEIQHAELVHSQWANKKESSVQYVRGLIQLNHTLGIYRESDGALVAWVFQNDFSGLGILQVMETVQRKGFGTIVAAELSKRIAIAEEVNLSVWVAIENFKSEALLQKLGYEKIATGEWIQLNDAD